MGVVRSPPDARSLAAIGEGAGSFDADRASAVVGETEQRELEATAQRVLRKKSHSIQELLQLIGDQIATMVDEQKSA